MDLKQMSREEKLKAMHALWEDLARDEDADESPEWHGQALRETEERMRSTLLLIELSEPRPRHEERSSGFISIDPLLANLLGLPVGQVTKLPDSDCVVLVLISLHCPAFGMRGLGALKDLQSLLRFLGHV